MRPISATEAFTPLDFNILSTRVVTLGVPSCSLSFSALMSVAMTLAPALARPGRRQAQCPGRQP